MKLIKIFLFSAIVFIIFLFVISHVAHAYEDNCNGVDDDGDGQCDEDFIANTICDGPGDTDSCQEGILQCPKSCGVAGVYCDDYTDSTTENCTDCDQNDEDCDGGANASDSECSLCRECSDNGGACIYPYSDIYLPQCSGDNLITYSSLGYTCCSCGDDDVRHVCRKSSSSFCPNGCESSPSPHCVEGEGETVPSAPTGLTHTGNTTISIAWDWNSSDGASYYKIYKADETLIATGINVSEYNQTSLASANTQYGVKVKACNATGDCSGFSDIASAYTSANPPIIKNPSNIIETSITWNWESAGSHTGYELRKEDKITLVEDTTDRTVKESGLTKCTSYTRYIGAYNGDYKVLKGAGDFVLQDTAMSAKTTGCALPPDLIIQDPSIAGTLTPGTYLSFSGIVKNQGGSSADVSKTYLGIDINSDDVVDESPAYASTGALAPGVSETETWSNAWIATAGTHKYTICADATGLVSESNETNNCTSSTFTITAANQAPIVSNISPGVKNIKDWDEAEKDVSVDTLFKWTGKDLDSKYVDYTLTLYKYKEGSGWIDPRQYFEEQYSPQETNFAIPLKKFSPSSNSLEYDTYYTWNVVAEDSDGEDSGLGDWYYFKTQKVVEPINTPPSSLLIASGSTSTLEPGDMIVGNGTADYIVNQGDYISFYGLAWDCDDISDIISKSHTLPGASWNLPAEDTQDEILKCASGEKSYYPIFHDETFDTIGTFDRSISVSDAGASSTSTIQVTVQAGPPAASGVYWSFTTMAEPCLSGACEGGSCLPEERQWIGESCPQECVPDDDCKPLPIIPKSWREILPKFY